MFIKLLENFIASLSPDFSLISQNNGIYDVPNAIATLVNITIGIFCDIIYASVKADAPYSEPKHNSLKNPNTFDINVKNIKPIVVFAIFDIFSPFYIIVIFYHCFNFL